MKKIHFLRTTLLGGLIFLVPFIVLLIILGKAIKIMHLVAKPIERFLPLESFAGVAIVDILSVLVIVVLCFFAGLAARSNPGKMVFRIADDTLMALIPGYALMKERLFTHLSQGRDETMLQPVLVTFDDHRLIAFEIERNDVSAVVFMPGSPDPWSGSSVVVELARVEKLDIEKNKVIFETFKNMGLGSLKLIGNSVRAAA